MSNLNDCIIRGGQSLPVTGCTGIIKARVCSFMDLTSSAIVINNADEIDGRRLFFQNISSPPYGSSIYALNVQTITISDSISIGTSCSIAGSSFYLCATETGTQTLRNIIAYRCGGNSRTIHLCFGDIQLDYYNATHCQIASGGAGYWVGTTKKCSSKFKCIICRLNSGNFRILDLSYSDLHDPGCAHTLDHAAIVDCNAKTTEFFYITSVTTISRATFRGNSVIGYSVIASGQLTYVDCVFDTMPLLHNQVFIVPAAVIQEQPNYHLVILCPEFYRSLPVKRAMLHNPEFCCIVLLLL